MTSVTEDAVLARLEPIDLYRRHLGAGEFVSAWIMVDQERIDRFAAATDDHQFIHVDPERARAETPFGGTIAHGFLSLSLLSTLAYESLPGIAGTRMGINYGFERVRFAAPVKAGARVRGRFRLAELHERAASVQSAWDATVEIENSAKPALTARWITLSILQPPADA